MPTGTRVQGGNGVNDATADAILTEPIFVLGPCGKRSLVHAVGAERVPGLAQRPLVVRAGAKTRYMHLMDDAR